MTAGINCQIITTTPTTTNNTIKEYEIFIPNLSINQSINSVGYVTIYYILFLQ